MSFERDKIYTIKLNSGEELVAKITDINTDTVTVSSPVSVAVGQQGLQMVPSLFSSSPDSTVGINKNSIALYSETRGDVENAYREATTGLTVPESKQILTG